MKLVSVFLLLFSAGPSSSRVAADQGTGQTPSNEVLDLEIKTLEKILGDLAFIEAEEEKNNIVADASATPWMNPCVLRELTETTETPDIQLSFEEAVKTKLDNWNYCLKKMMSHVAYANWDYVTNLTETNKEKSTQASVQLKQWNNGLSRNVQDLLKDPRIKDLDLDTQRQLRLHAQNTSPKNDKDIRDLTSLRDDLEQIYGTAKVGKLALDPDLQNILAHSRDPRMLLKAWKDWRRVTGPKMRDKYTEFVRLLNKGAKENHYADYSEAWMEEQFDQTDNIEAIAEELWREIKPLYEELHAYVRRKLYDYYTAHYPDENVVNEFGGIPAHLLGNMWAQEWANIYDMVKPYPEVDEPDYDKEMKKQKYTVNRLFSMAEEFYKSIGLFPMTETFKKNSMVRRPPPEQHREVVCHASAEDFYTKDDFRIKMCTKINIEDFTTIHHEMGHIEYFMAYENQPTVYRTGANSAFHEAVGDTIALSVMSRKHLEAIGLLKPDGIDSETQRKSDINYLLKKALSKIAFLPFGYMIDKWRWGVFRGTIKQENYNEKWWDIRLKYQGVVSPIERSEADFDPGSKYHIPSNAPYICYFISFIIQFQFYEAMCNASKHSDDLYNCDFYQSTAAGDLLRDALSLGKSVPWQDAMVTLTGSRDISATSIKKYFDPLYIWLKKENEEASKKAGRNVVGWAGEKIRWTQTGSYKKNPFHH